MKKQPQQLLAKKGLSKATFALLIFSTPAYIPNIHASVLVASIKPFIQVGESILSGKGASVVGTEDTASMMMWQALGYESAEKMIQVAKEKHQEYAALLERLAEQSASIENIEALPEGFVAPKGSVNNGKFIPTKASNIASSSSPSQGVGLFKELPTLPNLPNMALAQAAVDSPTGASDKIVPCKPGSNCGKLKALSKSVAEESEVTFNGSDYKSNSSSDGASTVQTSKGETKSFAKKFNEGFGHSESQRLDLASTASADPILVTNENTNESTVGDNVISGFNVNPTPQQLTDSNIFEQMPEGWLIHEDADTGIQVRGALDKKYIETKDGKKHPDNFLQVAVKKDVPSLGLKAGQIFTFEKCSIGCYDEHYNMFAEKLKEIQSGAPRVAVSIPGFVEAMTRLKDKDERTKIINESNTNLRFFKTALLGLGTSFPVAKGQRVKDQISRFYSGDENTRKRMAAYFRSRVKEILQN